MSPANSQDRLRSALPTILLLSGSFIFAFLLGELAHEWGHFAAHRAFGNTNIQIYLVFRQTNIDGYT